MCKKSVGGKGYPLRANVKELTPQIGTGYPTPLDEPCLLREKTNLGDQVGLSQFGVNLLVLQPGSWSAQRHWHKNEDEFVYILEGHPTLYTNDGKTPLAPGMCSGFKAGSGDSHCLMNETDEDVIYLEVGDRTPGDAACYPDDDLKALDVKGKWVFTRKDGTPY